MTITDTKLRQLFIDFFTSLDYQLKPSASIIPCNDPSILFINAGMAPLKQYFLSQKISQKLVSIQKCIRAGGKHNDLDNVGYTKRHHTFFEMCGNFSFGDCTREDAIDSAWKFLTDILNLERSKLNVTVHPDDPETLGIWQKYVARTKITFDATNEWSAGEIGPTGLCTEIYYDHQTGDPDDIVEIWNIVFITHNKEPDGSKKSLNKLCVDTGMGLERILAILSGSSDNYKIPLLKEITEKIELESGVLLNPSHKIIADHARASCIMISEGIVPGNANREYVLRRILRRAMRHEQKLNCIVLNIAVDIVSKHMSSIYPELKEHIEVVHQIINREREQYLQISQHGIKQLEYILNTKNGLLPEDAFRLYDTYGLHVDIIQDVLQERGLKLDMKKFDQIVDENRKTTTKAYIDIDIDPNIESVFIGYDQNICISSIKGLVTNGIILNQTTFYPEGGGQQSDHGIIRGDNWAFNVQNVQKYGKTIVHFGEYTTDLHPMIGDTCIASIDQTRRYQLAQHHSATHLLLSALRRHIGDHVVQKGSLVKADGLRFDFLHHNQNPTKIDYEIIEDQINTWIQNDNITETRWCNKENAQQEGAIATFGDKYDDTVRIVTIGMSKELCIGTHVNNTSQIGQFHILREYSISSGVKRIEAVCGTAAYKHTKENIKLVKNLCNKYKTTPLQLEKVIDTKMSYTKSNLDVVQKVEHISHNINICFLSVRNAIKNDAYKLIDQNINTYSSIFMINTTHKAHMLIMKTTKSFIENFCDAATILARLTNEYQSKSGGKPEVASGSVSLIYNIDNIHASLLKILQDYKRTT